MDNTLIFLANLPLLFLATCIIGIVIFIYAYVSAANADKAVAAAEVKKAELKANIAAVEAEAKAREAEAKAKEIAQLIYEEEHMYEIKIDPATIPLGMENPIKTWQIPDTDTMVWLIAIEYNPQPTAKVRMVSDDNTISDIHNIKVKHNKREDYEYIPIGKHQFRVS